ncbi:MAG TPA: hypothetical protein VFM29_00660 [Vicinamibacteria bacterium]|nr:hypothetical protein [Vicinamibacteria bacterium]
MSLQVQAMAMVKILVMGAHADDVRDEMRNALGRRPEHEEWVVSAVQLPTSWVASVLVSPGDRLTGWSLVGPARSIAPALAHAVTNAGLRPDVPRVA